MEMRALPGWVDPVAKLFVALAVLAAIAVAYDIYGRGYRQRVRSMEAVWALSALWLGPFALPLYARTGRPRSDQWQAEQPTDGELGLSAAAASGGLPGGAASLIGHVVGVPIVLAAGWSLFGVDMFAMIAVIAVLAIAMLFAFEYSTAARLFLMQVGIVLGFLTGYPAVALLLKRGTKVAV